MTDYWQIASPRASASSPAPGFVPIGPREVPKGIHKGSFIGIYKGSIKGLGFRVSELGVPYFGVLIMGILLIRVLH